MKNENNVPELPSNFFTKKRPRITNEENFKDVIPIKWSQEVLEGKKKAFVISAKEKLK